MMLTGALLICIWTALGSFYVFSSWCQQMRIGNGFDERVTIGPLIDRRAADAVCELIDEAVSRGAEVVLGGLSLSYSGTDSVRVTGYATNKNEYMVKNVAIGGVLLDHLGSVPSPG